MVSTHLLLQKHISTETNLSFLFAPKNHVFFLLNPFVQSLPPSIPHTSPNPLTHLPSLLPLLRRLRRNKLLPPILRQRPQRRHKKGQRHLLLRPQKRLRPRIRLAHRPQEHRHSRQGRSPRGQKSRRHTVVVGRELWEDGDGEDEGAESVYEWEVEG